MDFEFRAKLGKKVSRPHPVTKDVVEYVEVELGEVKVYLIKSDVLKPEESGEIDLLLNISPSGNVYISQRPTVESQTDRGVREENYRKHLQEELNRKMEEFKAKEDAREEFEKKNQLEIERLQALAPPTAPVSPIERGDIVERDRAMKSAAPTASGQAPVKGDVTTSTVTTDESGNASTGSKLAPPETVDDKAVKESGKTASAKAPAPTPLTPKNPSSELIIP